jgi:FlaA1/EpsC-like NDP-sugar epimerase
MLSWVERIPRRGKQLIAAAVDAATVACSVYGVLALRFETWTPQVGLGTLGSLMGTAVVVSLPVFWGAGLYREILRYIGLRFAARAAFAVLVATLVTTVVVVLLDRATGIPRSTPLMFAVATCGCVITSRALARTIVRRLGGRGASRALVYGASDMGAGLVAMLAQDQRTCVVAFVDDDPARVGTSVHGIPVHGAARVHELVESLRIDTVLLALPESSRRRRRELFDNLSGRGLRVMLVPTLQEIADGTARVDAIRSMRIEDLLGRAPVEPKTALLSRNIAGENVLITGAGGSIGSEIARQVLKLGPRRLVLLDHSEYALYQIDSELRQHQGSSGSVPIVPVLASVTDEVRMERVIAEHAIGTLYHAAAYKHVPIVEANEIEGLAVNAIGTLRTAQAAMRAGVKSFVLVSTDKAVRPTSVMGASKRLAEKCLQALAEEQGRVHAATGTRRAPTRFTMVRFGNVLDSSGSVVPLFSDQIRRGGPVTVTHEGITRFFMTIPEASSLVIQAGAMGKGGEVFVLDMGEPVRIMDLARSMIRLAGYKVQDAETPDGDIEIVVTGLRPGEKLFEELLIGENCERTEHPAIMQAREPFLPWGMLEPMLARLQSTLDQHDTPGARAQLARIVSGYAQSDVAK